MNETATAPETQGIRQRHLLNRSVVRRFILETLSDTRPQLGLTRVSGQALDALESWLREKIRSEVHSHPSVGRTFKL